jgi:hypothetical protein
VRHDGHARRYSPLLPGARCVLAVPLLWFALGGAAGAAQGASSAALGFGLVALSVCGVGCGIRPRSAVILLGPLQIAGFFLQLEEFLHVELGCRDASPLDSFCLTGLLKVIFDNVG